MPVIVFKCPEIGCPSDNVEYDEMHDIREPKYESKCQYCGADAVRVWMDSAPMIQFVGNDFHVNSYDKNGRKGE